MDVVITGGTGFIGSNLAIKLDEKGHNVTVASLHPDDSALPLSDSVNREKLDVTNPDTIDFEDTDVVIHLIGLSPLFQPSISYEKIHVEGTKNVVEAAREADVNRFIHMSALGADPKAPTEYLRTKAEAEKFVKDLDMDHAILRPSVIFGDGDEFITGLKKASRIPVLPLPGGGRNRFQPIYVEDIAEIFTQLVESGCEDEVLELGGPEKLSMREIVQKIGKSLGRKPVIIPMPMFLVATGLKFAELIPFLPFGEDQYNSLKIDNTVERNDAEQFLDNFTSLEDYLD